MNSKIYRGHHIRKRFGQNFLTDQIIIDRIVSAIQPQPDQAIVEIGPGLGALTEPVCAQINHMTVIELDRDLAYRLANISLFKNKLTIYQKDATKVNFDKIAKRTGKPLRIFGNLPYNISISLIFHLFPYLHAIHDMHFMLQKEVFNRLISPPNTKTYGRLSLMAQYYCDVTPILEVPPLSFTPTPKVDSAVIRLQPHRVMPNSVSDVCKLNYIITRAFNQRRKTIGNSLGDLFTSIQLMELRIDTSLRAENLSIAQYCKLANWLIDHPPKKQ